MKCAIVTVYNSENCGSYLQAFSLFNAVRCLGHEAFIVPNQFNNSFFSIIDNILFDLKCLLRRDIYSIHLKKKRHIAFLKAQEYFLFKDKSQGDIECVILGSDTIWDVSSPFFYKHRNFFWGLDFINSKIISYAASLGYANVSHLNSWGRVGESLSRMSSISVRESSARDILRSQTNKEISVVCDPTILLPKKYYDDIKPNISYTNFIFIYYYGKMPKDYIVEIQDIARKENLETIVFGNTCRWCDVSIEYDPILFLSMVDKASYVITNTFHGMVFSHIYEKRFAVINAARKPKVLNFLKAHETSDKLASLPQEIDGILHSDFDYIKINHIFLKERDEGLDYLKKAIEK